MENQLSFFDQPIETYLSTTVEATTMNVTVESNSIDYMEPPLFIIDQTVYVPKPSKKIDVEDYYYLEDFANEVGKITRIYSNNQGHSYDIAFKNKTGIFREKEIIPYMKTP